MKPHPPRRSLALTLLLLALALPAWGQEGLVDLEAHHDGASDSLRLLLEQQGPELRVTSPGFGSVLADNVVTLSGEVSDRFSQSGDDPAPLFTLLQYRVYDEIGVVIDTGETFVVEGRFTIPGLVLGSGYHAIEIEAFDSAGIEGGAVHEVLIDPTAPSVALVAPRDGEVVLAASVALTLNFASAMTLVSVNGTTDGRSFPAGLAEDAVTVPLVLGANAIELVVDDGTGPTTLSFTLFRVASIQPIRIVEPPDGALRNTPLLPVTVLAPLGTPFVQIAGLPATPGPDGVTFTAEVPIRAGENEITAVAAPSGQRASARVVGDFRPPGLFALLPPDGTVTAGETLDLVAFSDEPVRVQLDGPTGTRTATAVFDPARSNLLLNALFYRFELPGVALEPGDNPFELTLVDPAGNQNTRSFIYMRASEALSLVAPAPGATIDASRVDVEIQALAPVTIDAWYAAGRRLAGFDGTSLAAGLATFAFVPLVAGTNEMRIVYRRADGTPEVLRFELVSTAPAGAVVTGMVRDLRTGAPLSGVLVRITAGGVTLVVVTAADGSYRAEVEAGTVQIAVQGEGFVASTSELAASAGTTASVDFALVPWGTTAEGLPGAGPGITTSRVEGVVTDAASGAPLADTAVVVTAGTLAFETTTDGEGAYAVAGIPAGPFTVAFARPGYRPQLFEVPFDTPVAWRIDAALEPLPPGGVATSSLFGRVFDEDTGAGLAGAAITVDRDGTILTATSEPDGAYLVEGIPPGPFAVSVALDGYVTRSFEVPFEDAAPVEVDVGLVASGASGGAAASVVRGTVRDETDRKSVV